MAVSIMVAGSLFRDPAQNTAKTGKSYAVATIKAAAGNEAEFWTALAFGETEMTELMRLAEGEKLTVQGSPKIEAKAGADGAIKVYRTVFVDAVLALKPKPKEAKPKPAKRTCGALKSAGASQGPLFERRERELDDAIPF
jgi:hypothetical protein